jgi:hypothetical protein
MRDAQFFEKRMELRDWLALTRFDDHVLSQYIQCEWKYIHIQDVYVIVTNCMCVRKYSCEQLTPIPKKLRFSTAGLAVSAPSAGRLFVAIIF